MSLRLDPTPLIRPFAVRRLRQVQTQDPVVEQERALQRLLRTAADTRFGRDHGFERLTTVEAYQAAVPLRTFDDLWAAYWQAAFPIVENVTWPGRIPYFAMTSGTTSGRSKYIPLTHATLRQNRRSALDMLCAHLAATPSSRYFSGRTLFLGGSTALDQEADGVLSGDLSGIVNQSAPTWMRPFTYPPADVALMPDWDAKLDRIASDVGKKRITSLSGIPSWMIGLFDRLEQLHATWPLADLELLVHGGVAWTPYAKRFAPILARSGASTREVYAASEGFIAFQDGPSGEGLHVTVDTGLFFEFVPTGELGAPEPTRHWMGTIEPDVDYAIAITGPSGLFSYILGDTVRFVETNPPRLLITGRTAYMLSAFGEHLIQAELDAAVTAAVEGAGANLAEYVAGPVIPDHGPGRHRFYIETAETRRLDAGALARAVDDWLKDSNDDYRAHRGDGVSMTSPEVRLVPPGTFAEWMRRQGKLGGQHKVPRVVADAARFRVACDDLDALGAEVPDPC